MVRARFLSHKKISAISFAVLMSLRSATLLAATDNEQGPAGAAGTQGSSGTVAGNGEPGGNGGDANATAISTDASNTATATGGNGGIGGEGGWASDVGQPGGTGGQGGNGGNAIAVAGNSAPVAGPANATSTANGGFGAYGGSGGDDDYEGNLTYGTGGAGGNGGDAQASAYALNTTSDPVTISATAIAGNGYGGGAAGYDSYDEEYVLPVAPGGTGGIASLGEVSGTSTGGGNVSVSGIVEATSDTANGDGINESLDNAVSGSTTGTLSITQVVQAGEGQSVQNGGADVAGGTGGSASSTLCITQNNLAELAGSVTAYGGSGGSVGNTETFFSNPIGGNAGSSTALIDLTSNSPISASATASGYYESGGGIVANFHSDGSGGTGGIANASAMAIGTGTTANTSEVTVSAEARGSSGGYGGSIYDHNVGGNGGAGGSATATANGSNAGSGALSVSAIAYGGNGGSSVGAGFSGGSGGSASATASASSSSTPSITVSASATGGSGGSGNTNGQGGSASAIVIDQGLTVEQDSAASGQQGGTAWVSIGRSTLDFGNINNGFLTLSGTGAVSISRISGGGTLTINGPTLQIEPQAGGPSQSKLVITGGGTLDITNNHFFINYGTGPDPIASIAAWIASGYAGGAWNGTGIISTNAQTNSGSYGIGYADSADPGNPAGLATNTIEIMYTLLGDANLDGKVNGTDFTLMAANFNDSVTNGWDEGDFNYSGTVNGDDFVLLADNFNQFASQSDVSAADLSVLDSFAAANGISLTSVPEPQSIAMLAVAAAGLTHRRRKPAPSA